MKPEKEVRNVYGTESRGIEFVASTAYDSAPTCDTLRVNSLSCNNIVKYVKIRDKYCTRIDSPKKFFFQNVGGVQAKVGVSGPPPSGCALATVNSRTAG